MAAEQGFRPAQPQRWDVVAPYAAAAGSAAAARELRGWALLAVGALALAGVFALLLALSRLPGAEDWFAWPVAFFEKGLVIHVVFSFVVWFLAVMALLATLATYRAGGGQPRLRAFGPVALGLGIAAFALLALPAALDRGDASLNNYVPVISDPLYYGGLALLAAAMALVSLRLLVNLAAPQGPVEPVAVTTGAAALLYLVALAMVLWDAAAWVGPIGDAFNEATFWGGGHILQFVNVALMLAAWYVLGGHRLGRPPVHPRVAHVAAALLVGAGVAGAVGGYMLFEPLGYEHRQMLTDLQYLLAPPALLVGGVALVGVLRDRGRDDDAGARLCLLASMAVFALGGVLGLFVDGTDARTPAHYHGVIGGVNIAFMGLFFVLVLPVLGRALARGRAIAVMVWLYAVGQALHSLGLFMAGGYGAPRKTPGAEGLDGMGATAGLYMMGVGAVIAVLGGVAFIVVVGRALLRRPAGA